MTKMSESRDLAKGFRNEADFQLRTGDSYTLLPLRFLPLDSRRYIVTNFVGEIAVLGRDELQALVCHELPMGLRYDELKAKHFLIDGDSQTCIDLLACKYRTRHSLLKELTSLFIFVVSLRCEHSCPYCQVSRRSHDKIKFDMRQEDAERALDIVFQSPSQLIKLEFQGGEPLLNFELIQWIVERAQAMQLKSPQRQIEFVIATNLALINESMLSFCKQHNIQISTSLDGPRELHNSNRPRSGNDSFERTIEGIRQCRAVLGDGSVAALMTTTKASLSQPEAIIDEYVAQGFSSIFLRPLSPYGFAVKTGAIYGYDVDEWLVFYKRGIRHILNLNRKGVMIREDYASLLLRKMLTPFPQGYVDLQSPAGIGISAMAFNYNGYIYASDEARMLAEMGDETFRLGHVSDATLSSILCEESFVNVLATTMTEGMPMCSDCGIQPFCGSDPTFHHATQGDVVGRKPASSFCRRSMELVRFLVTMFEDSSNDRDILRTWIY